MLTDVEISDLIGILEENYPEPICALEYDEDYQLLFAARLAAQCTDARVNTITPVLFKRYTTLLSIAQAQVSNVESIIRPCGFYKTKARDIVLAAGMLINEFEGRVPDTMEALLRLPGVGRKTANLMLGDIHKLPAVVVDTHCIRLSNRIGLVNTKDTLKIETKLREMLPPEKSSDFCHRLVLHGRAVCKARSPSCPQCRISSICEHNNGNGGG